MNDYIIYGIIVAIVLALVGFIIWRKQNKEESIPSWFDASYYRNRYSDLTGMSDRQLYEHYVNHGKAEGRTPNASGETTTTPKPPRPKVGNWCYISDFPPTLGSQIRELNVGDANESPDIALVMGICMHFGELPAFWGATCVPAHVPSGYRTLGDTKLLEVINLLPKDLRRPVYAGSPRYAKNDSTLARKMREKNPTVCSGAPVNDVRDALRHGMKPGHIYGLVWNTWNERGHQPDSTDGRAMKEAATYVRNHMKVTDCYRDFHSLKDGWPTPYNDERGFIKKYAKQSRFLGTCFGKDVMAACDRLNNGEWGSNVRVADFVTVARYFGVDPRDKKRILAIIEDGWKKLIAYEKGVA